MTQPAMLSNPSTMASAADNAWKSAYALAEQADDHGEPADN
jgi:hypothetical protein